MRDPFALYTDDAPTYLTHAQPKVGHTIDKWLVVEVERDDLGTHIVQNHGLYATEMAAKLAQDGYAAIHADNNSPALVSVIKVAIPAPLMKRTRYCWADGLHNQPISALYDSVEYARAAMEAGDIEDHDFQELELWEIVDYVKEL